MTSAAPDRSATTWVALVALVVACGSTSTPRDDVDAGVVDDEPEGGAGGGGSDVGGRAGIFVALDAATPNMRLDASLSVPDTAVVPAAADCGKGFFCDDFEALALNERPPPPWRVSFEPQPTHGAITVDEAHAFSGKRSVHLTVSNAPGEKFSYIGLKGAPYFSPPRRLLYGRMMMWLANLPNTNTHWSNIEASGSIAGMSASVVSAIHYGGQYGKLLAAWGTKGTPNLSDCALRAPNLTLPTKTWTCLEWRYDTSANEMRLWMNGKALPELTVMGRGQECVLDGTAGKWLLPDMNAVNLGWANYQNMGANEMWIDDVVFGSEPIGCPASLAAH